MGLITNLEDDSQATAGEAITDKKDAFIGCTVPQYIKDGLIREALHAPGGARNVSWAINQILAKHFNKEQTNAE